MSDGKLTQLAINGSVATVTLDSPENRNALSSKMIRQLGESIETVINSDARVLVITNTGDTFCAGMDLKERIAGGGDLAGFGLLLKQIIEAPIPTIAAVRGNVRAGGIGLMAACDFAVVEPNTTFAFTEVRIGVAPAMIAVPVLRRVSPAIAGPLMISGETFDATAALGIGLISHLSSNIDDAVREILSHVLKGSKSAIAATKELVRSVPLMSVGDAISEMTKLSEALFDSQDGREGIASFVEKRPPRWTV